MNERIYYVVSNNGTVMGLFSTKERAEDCKRYYENKMPESDFVLNWDIIDLNWELIDLIDF